MDGVGINQELVKQEMFAAALRGQVHAGGAAMAGAQAASVAQNTSGGLNPTDSVEISQQAVVMAAAATDTE